jgi:hypothetical protein
MNGSVQKDAFGLELTTNSAEARAAYRLGVEALLNAAPHAERHFDAALELDPDFALAHAASGFVSANSGQPAGKALLSAERLSGAVTPVGRLFVDGYSVGGHRRIDDFVPLPDDFAGAIGH